MKRLIGIARTSAAVGAGRDRAAVREARAALAAGASADDLREAVLQTYLFAGFPRAINGFIALAAAGAGAGRPPLERPASPAAWRRRGERLCRRIYGRDFEALMRRMEGLHPDFADWILVEGYGKTLSRPHLAPRERELVVVPVLAALGAWRQLPSHAKGAWNVGALPGEPEAVLRGCRGLLPARALARALRIVADLRRERRRRERPV